MLSKKAISFSILVRKKFERRKFTS